MCVCFCNRMPVSRRRSVNVNRRADMSALKVCGFCFVIVILILLITLACCTCTLYLRTCAIPEHLRGVFTTRHYTNTPLPLPLPAGITLQYLALKLFRVAYCTALLNHYTQCIKLSWKHLSRKRMRKGKC